MGQAVNVTTQFLAAFSIAQSFMSVLCRLQVIASPGHFQLLCVFHIKWQQAPDHVSDSPEYNAYLQDISHPVLG